MKFETITLLENITVNSAYGREYQAGSDLNTVFYSEKNRGAGYYNTSMGLHTVLYHTEGFLGSVVMQATLELYPGKDDWFDVHSEIFAADSADSDRATTFVGKFVFVRAMYHIQDGKISTVQYSC